MKVWKNPIGYVNIVIEGKYPERLLNLLMHRGVPIRDAERHEGRVDAVIPAGCVSSLRLLRRGSGCRVKIKEKGRLYLLRRRIRQNRVFVSAFLLFFSALMIASTRLWFIEVESSSIPKDEVLSKLGSAGVRRGAHRDRNRLGELSELLKEDQRVVNAKVALHGVVLKVSLSESGEAIPDIETGEVTGIYAQKDCVINSISVTAGRALVKAGEAVKAGELLVTGDLSNLKEGYYVSAEAYITGEVLYAARASVPLKSTSLVRSGQSCERIVISVLGHELFPDRPYERFESERLDSMTIDAGPIPLSLVKSRCFELTECEIEDTFESASERARLAAQEKLSGLLPENAAIKTVHTDVMNDADGKVTAIITVTAVEIIGTNKD